MGGIIKRKSMKMMQGKNSKRKKHRTKRERTQIMHIDEETKKGGGREDGKDRAEREIDICR